MTHYLVRRGLLEQRSAPAPHVVAKCTTFKHPTANLYATIYLTSNIAVRSYWNFTRYSLHDRFDRIICEDGDYPVSSNSTQGMIAKLLRTVLPIFPYRMIVDSPIQLQKYKCMNLYRDTVESRMAFESVKRNDDPIVDPRARRVCEALDKLAMSTTTELSTDDIQKVGPPLPADGGAVHVALPWHMYHAPYISEKLQKQGWTKHSVHEEILATRSFMMKVMFAGFWTTIMLVWFAASFTMRLLFGWY